MVTVFLPSLFAMIVLWLLSPFLTLAASLSLVSTGVCLQSSFCRLPRKPNICFPKWPSFVLFLLLGVRFGEALHPGPKRHAQSDPATFCIGCFNPSGLAGKAQVINEYLPFGDLWSVAETHLTTRSLSSFRRGLGVTKSPFCYLTAGYPVPVRQHSQSSGVWKGVAVLSKHPTRAVPTNWDQDLVQSGRALISATLLHDMWLTVGTVYGESAGTWHPDHLQNTNRILHAVASQVCLQSSGLRVVAGDFNVGEDDVTAFNILHACGFKDLQTIAWEKWGIQIENTCKSTTRVDYCYVSPELQQMLQEVHVLQDVWPDHAVLYGRFAGNVRDVPRFVWRQPQPIDWPEFTVAPVGPICPGRETEQYASMWHDIEAAAAECQAKPIPKASRGRAQVLRPRKVLGQAHAPLKPPRAGDVRPGFVGTSLQHAHWYRQVRRLQAYVRFAKARNPHAHPAHAGTTWGAIKRAKGFEPNFVARWKASRFQVHSAPAVCPDAPPSVDVAQAIYDSCLIALRHLENDLKRSSRAQAKARRLANPQLIFQDLRVPGPDSLDLLIQPFQAKIIHIEEESLCLQVDCHKPWNLQQPLYIGGFGVEIIHHEDCWLWVDSLDNIRCGDTCTQLKLTGALKELFAEFQQTWSRRWDRHKDIPDSQWDSILAFASRYAHPVVCPSPSLTPDKLRQEIRRKKSRSARGLDGVSLTDFRKMPDEVLQSYCNFYSHAEACGTWPHQLAVGRVASIAKNSQPQSAADFRPITVLSLGYRLWSSYHSRNMIAALDTSLPAGLYGSRIASHSGMVWSSILLAVEEAHDCGVPLAGIVCDIEKAFNCLSRSVVFGVAALMQLPMHILKGWAGMLNQLARHFDVRKSLSPATYSSTGFPEGDGLSVVAMILLDCVLHWWMAAGYAPCRTLSFVDDWQMLLQSPDQVAHALKRLETFCTLVDLTLDRRKTYVWCLSPDGRKLLKNQGFKVGHGGRNLGAHLQLTRQHTNATIQDRVRSLGDMWDRLRLSSCPYRLKVRALTVAAWPRGLHGVASTAVGNHLLARLRSGAMRGLQADGAGCSPWIHLGLIEQPSCDPTFWSVIQTIRCVRDCAAVDFMQPVLTHVVGCPDAVPSNSFTNTLVTRLQLLGWSIRPDGLLEDFIGPFCLFRSNFTEVEWRASLGWQAVVAQKTRHRDGLQNLEHADVPATREWLRSLAAEDAGHCRKLLNGAHFTCDAKQHWCDEPDGVCSFCQCTDSRYHRFWQCDGFAEFRCGVSPVVWDLLPYLPEVLTCYGWGLRPASWLDFQRSLQAIPEGSFDLTPLLPLVDDWIDLFTDGSCRYPHHPWRIASWAVVQAEPTCLDIANMSSVVLAACPLQGAIQTAFRAELRAALEALRIGRALKCKVRIWCDCQGIVSKLTKLCLGTLTVKANGRHSDLWGAIAELVADIGTNNVVITKVASHQDCLCQTAALHAWCFVNNGMADHAAAVANHLRPEAFLALHDRFIVDSRFAMYVSRQVQGVLLAVSRAAVQHQITVDAEGGECTKAPPQHSLRPDLPRPVFEAQSRVPAEVCARYGKRIVVQIAAWFQQAIVRSQDCGAMWVSFYQLYSDYMLCCGEGGPVNLSGWCDPISRPNLSMLDISFKLRCRWFTRLLKELWRAWQYAINVQFTRPHSETLILHASCGWIPWETWRLDCVESWLSARLQGPAKRDGRALLRLPTAKRDCLMPTIEGDLTVR